MTGEANPVSSEGDFSIADMLGANFPSPIELADTMSEAEIRNRIAEIEEQRISTKAEIARLESEDRRLRGESILTQEALRIATDKGLE